MKTYAEVIEQQSENAYSYRVNGRHSYQRVAETIAFIYEMSVDDVIMDIDKACGGLSLGDSHSDIPEDDTDEFGDRGIWAEN